MSKADCLTEFGNALSSISQGLLENRDKEIKIDKNILEKGYEKNSLRLSALRRLLPQRDIVFLLAPGHISNSSIESINRLHKAKRAYVCGVNFTSFQEKIDHDLLISTHVTCLMASALSKTPPKGIIHGVYSAVPPVVSSSCTIRWGDPFKTFKQDNAESAEFIIKVNEVNFFPFIKAKPSEYRIQVQNENFTGNYPFPFITAPRNVMMFASYFLAFAGARRIIFAGFDPKNPDFFFTNHDPTKMEIARCIAMSNPFISAWDGRDQRISPVLQSIYRQNDMIKDILREDVSTASGEGWRFKELKRAVNQLKEICLIKGIGLNYLGESTFCNDMKISPFKEG